MPVLYNSKAIIPAPLVTMTKDFVLTQDGSKIGTIFNIAVNGTLVAWKGSPNSAGTFWTLAGYPPDETIAQSGRLAALLSKQEALRGLFSVEGQSFEIQPLDGTTPIKFYPRVVGPIIFDEGIWTDKCDYQINLEADIIYGRIYPTGEDNFAQFLSDAKESWSVEHNDAGEDENATYTYRLTHDLSAVGKRHYDDTGTTLDAWKQARTWVQARVGIDSTISQSSGALNLPAYLQGYDHVRSETVDYFGGGYGINESWILSSGAALEDFTVSVVTNTDDNLAKVSINGEIRGLASRNSSFGLTQSKYTAANNKFIIASGSMFSRAQAYSQLSLNASPVSTNVARNPIAGNISYSWEYDNRPTNAVANSLSEIITIGDINPVDIFAAIPVLGRGSGPVLQAINTSGERIRSVTVEIVMPVATGTSVAGWYSQKPNVNSVINALIPNGTQVFKNEDSEQWSPKIGRYSRDVRWVWEK